MKTKTSITTGSALGLLAALVIGLAAPFMSSAQASEVEIKPSHFKYSGFVYFRGASESVQLGSYGEKKTPVGKAHYLAVQNRISGENLKKYAKVPKPIIVPIEWSKYSKTDVEAGAGLKYFTLGGSAAVAGSYEKLKTAKLKLAKFAIDEGHMKATLNHSPGALNYLRDEGGDGRVVPVVWLLLEGQLAESFEKSTDVEVTGSGGGPLKITARAKVGTSSEGAQTIELPPNTAFAYSMMKVKDWSKGKAKIDNLEDDQAGLN